MPGPFPIMRAKKGGNSINDFKELIRQQAQLEMLQGRQREGQKLAPDEVVTGRHDLLTGATTRTSAGSNIEVNESLRKKASDDALKLQQSLPILDDLEKSYLQAYQNYHGSRQGLSGGVGATGEFVTGVLGRQNPALRQFIDKSSQYEVPLVKLTGDVGNISASERSSIRAGIPKASPNIDWTRLFLPDDPEYGLSKIEGLKKMFASKYEEALNVSKTGQLSEGYKNWIQSPSQSTPTVSNNQQQYQIGQELVAKGKKYRIVGLDDPNDPDLEEIQ